MDFTTGLALVLLALVGYSSGAVLSAKGCIPVPGIVDLVAVAITWIAALATRTALGKWSAIGIWFFVGLILGAVLALIRTDNCPKAQSMTVDGGLWNVVKDFAQQMGNYQSRVLMAFVYFIVVMPFGLGVMLLGNPLKIRRVHTDSNWRPKELSIKPSIDEARRQF